MGTLRDTTKAILRSFGFDLVRYSAEQGSPQVTMPQDMSTREQSIYRAVSPYTKTSPERILSVISATRYVVENDIQGDVVECGVWRGGSIMAAAMSLVDLGDTTRTLYLYDTFEGMTDPTSRDRVAGTGKSAQEIFDVTPKGTGTWCYASLEEVQHNLQQTEYPENQIRYVQGPVEETLPQEIPEQIALLRLDTDFYDSTLHELNHLYPRLAKGGVLIIDDYGHWEGAQQATDEYFAGHKNIFLHRIDYTGRLIIKP